MSKYEQINILTNFRKVINFRKKAQPNLVEWSQFT